MQTLVYVRAMNDADGNPRRGWIVTWMDNQFIQEGYHGRRALYRFFLIDGQDEGLDRARLNFDRNVNEITLTITAAQYNRLVKGE